MRYGICNLSIVSLRLEPAHQSEMLSQVLFGEHFKVLEQRKDWSKIRLFSDGYEGFIDNKQYVEITEELYTKLTNETPCVSGELIDFISSENNQLITIPIGSQLPLFDGSHCYIQSDAYSYDGLNYKTTLPKDELIQKSFHFLNSPYLWCLQNFLEEILVNLRSCLLEQNKQLTVLLLYLNFCLMDHIALD